MTRSFLPALTAAFLLAATLITASCASSTPAPTPTVPATRTTTPTHTSTPTATHTPIPGPWAKLKNTSFYSSRALNNPLPASPIAYDYEENYFAFSFSIPLLLLGQSSKLSCSYNPTNRCTNARAVASEAGKILVRPFPHFTN